MKGSLYRKRDYAFGQTMLTLRNQIGLTQASLAERLHVSRKAVGEWEGGLNYPIAEHLKAFIALAVEQQARAFEREEEEIRALWQTARQKVPLDETWLGVLLSHAEEPPTSLPVEKSISTAHALTPPAGDGRASIGATRSPSRPSMGVWDVRSGERVRALAGHPGMVYAVAWSPTGTVLVSGGGDGMLRWWDVERGECAQVRLAHQGTVQRLQVSPDGSRLASCGDDGAIHVWELESGEHLRMLRRDRPYERLDITGIRGVTEAQKASLRALGAIEDAPSSVLFKRSGHPSRRFSL